MQSTVETIRRFNRFYTVNMGFLSSQYLDGGYSIAETRTLFELYINRECTQADIVKKIHIDKSYLNRIIKRFEKNGLLHKRNSETDKRASIIALSEKGTSETERLIVMTNRKIAEQIKDLSDNECCELESAINTIINILGKTR